MVEFEGPLQSALQHALQQVCGPFDVAMLERSLGYKAAYLMTRNNLEGILVNGNIVNFRQYLESDHGRKTVRRVWDKRRCMILPSLAVPITDL